MEANTYAREVARRRETIEARDLTPGDVIMSRAGGDAEYRARRIHSVARHAGYVTIIFYGGQVIEPSDRTPCRFRYLA